MANAGVDVKERELFCIVGGNVNWWNHYEKQYEVSSEN